MGEKYDTEQIKRDNSLSDYLMRRGVNLKKDGREFKACCPFHSESTPSFTVYQSREGFQKYQCFGCGENGNVIDYVQRFDAVDFVQACEILSGTRAETGKQWTPILRHTDYFDPYKGLEILTPPVDAPAFEEGKRTPKLRNPKRETEGGGPEFVTYTPSLVHPYRDAAGTLLGYVLRVDIGDDRKITPLILWCRKGEWEGWSHGTFAEPRPLYGLDRNAEHPNKQWFVGEGEKVADVLAALIPQMVAITWQGGGKAPHKTDWSPAKGKSIVNAMDNDDEGERTMLGFWKADDWRPGVVEMQLKAGAKAVKLIGRDPNKPEGWDLADGHLEEGWSPDQILAYAKANAKPWTLTDIEARKKALKNSAPVNAPPGADSPAGETNPSPATHSPRPQMKVVHGGQAVPASAPLPQQDRIVVPGEVPEIKRYSTALAIDDTVDIPLLARMEMDDKGNPRKKSLHNYIAASRYHPQMKDVLAWDEFAGRMMLLKRPPWIAGAGAWEPRKFEEDDAMLAAAWFSRAIGLQPQPDECGKAMLTAAKATRINPVRDWLEGLKWDGLPRVQGEANVCAPWLTEYLGARGTKINRAFGMRWLIAAVARVYKPGCKVDTMLVLEGDQGKGKSTALRTLATFGEHDYFTDSLHDFKGKDAVQQMTGKWIAEIPELDAMWRSEASTVKAFITRQVDAIRIPYAKHVDDFPRTSILAGTINPSGTGWMKDTTGNRRFWPVLVAGIDVARLAEDRSQIWAEAVHLYKSGEQWWLTDEEEILARKEQEKRQEQEPWADAIDEIVAGKSKILLGAVMDVLNLPRSQQNKASQARVADYLRSIGWERKKDRFPGFKETKWGFVLNAGSDQADD